MGHERVGVLPHTNPWMKIVAQLTALSTSESDIAEIARTTLQNVRKQFRYIHTDRGVKAAFTFLIALATSGHCLDDTTRSIIPKIDLSTNPSPLKLATLLQNWIDTNRDSLEYGDIAKRSASDAIAYWTSQQTQQLSLLASSHSVAEIWHKASNGTGFCDISRVFFSKFTERYLNYFLCRCSSAVLTDITQRQLFSERMMVHVEVVSKYAFETSKIMQSFAAGWFNNYVVKHTLSDRAIENFLRIAFGKLQDELLREVSNQ